MKAEKMLFKTDPSINAINIYNSFTNKAKNLMRSSDFDPAAFEQLRVVSKTWPTRPGIYLRWYTGLKGIEVEGQPYNNGKYVGKTKNWKMRDYQHNKEVADAERVATRSVHYQTAKHAEACFMVPLAIMPHNQILDEDLLDVAELICVCLLQSWWAPLSSASSMETEGSDGRYLADCAAAFHLKRFTDSVFSTTG